MSCSESIPGAATAERDGEVYALSNEEGRKALVKALRTGTGEGPVVLRDVTVFRDGWNRNGLGFSPGALQRVSDTARGNAQLFDHNSLLRLGRVLDSRIVTDAEGSAIVQSLEYSTQLGLDTLALGVIPEFSIQWQTTEDTVIDCSVCDAPMLSDECPHWPGDRTDEGKTVMALWSDATHAETSQTFTPAVPGTGPGQLSAISFLQQLAARSGGGGKMTEKKTAPDPGLVDLSAKLALAEQRAVELSARLERMECERVERESTAIVTALRHEGRLVGDELAMLKARAENPVLFDTILSFVQPNSAHTMGQTTGGADGAPNAMVSQTDFYALRDRVVARMAENPKLNADKVWAEERQAMRDGGTS